MSPAPPNLNALDYVTAWRPSDSIEVLLHESLMHMNIELHERDIADVLEAVDLAGLDDEDVARPRLALLAVYRPPAAAFAHEGDLVVRVSMQSRRPSRR